MEKYATYNVFENIHTGEIKRVPLTEEKEMVKLANHYNWKLLDSDPQLEEEKHEREAKCNKSSQIHFR
jgi:hypothetical protein